MRLVFDDPTTGSELVRTVSGPNAPSTVEVRFEPANPSDRLIGEPTAWCNAPGSGQPLIFTVPAPAKPADPDTAGTLKVRRSGVSFEAQVRITIKHTI